MAFLFGVQKSYTYIPKLICQYFIMGDVFILTDVSDCMKVKLTRVAKGLRQIDVAAAAHVDTTNITRLGKGRYVLPTRRKRIFTVLGLIVTKHMEKD